MVAPLSGTCEAGRPASSLAGSRPAGRGSATNGVPGTVRRGGRLRGVVGDVRPAATSVATSLCRRPWPAREQLASFLVWPAWMTWQLPLSGLPGIAGAFLHPAGQEQPGNLLPDDLSTCRGVITASSSSGKMSSGAIGDRSTWERLLSPTNKDLPRFGPPE